VDGNEISRALYGKGKDYDEKETTNRLANHEGPSQAIRPGQESDGNHRSDSNGVIPILLGEKQQSAVSLGSRSSCRHEYGSGEIG